MAAARAGTGHARDCGHLQRLAAGAGRLGARGRGRQRRGAPGRAPGGPPTPPHGPGPNGEPTTVDAILAGDIDLIVNTPYGVGSRLDGYEIRTAAVTRGVPCITTVQGLAATVQGIEALLAGEVGVRSLQEHAADLHALRAAALTESGTSTDGNATR